MDPYFFSLSLVQAVTEFLPVSSSAHLLLVSKIFNQNHMSLEWEVALHFGTLFAVIVYFRKDLWGMILGCLSALRNPKRPFSSPVQQAILLVCATLPTVLIGFMVKKMGVPVFPLTLMATITAFFGVLLYVADVSASSKKELNFKKAVLLGTAQAMAFIPGVSRSGICITVMRFMGIHKAQAITFSFLLSIPVVLGAVTLTSLDIFKAGLSIDWANLIQAIALTFFLGLCMIHFLLWYISRFSFLLFMVYRIVLGAGILFFTS
jgi:undecaprenyl-diphosphatase